MVSVRKILRSRFMPLIFLGALLILGVKTCGSEGAQIELVVDFGAAASEVRELRIDLYRGTDVAPVAYHRASFGEGGASAGVSWKVHIDAGSYTARFMVKSATATVNTTRKFEATDRAKVTISLERDLTGEF